MSFLPRKIVFVHHGRVLGGAPVSLSLLINQLRAQAGNAELSVWCVGEKIQHFFEERCGVNTRQIPNPGLLLGRALVWPIFFLETRKAILSAKELCLFPFRIYQQKELLEEIRPDVVHLNSAILFSSAVAARMAGIPVVWHVREILAGLPLKRRPAGWLIRRLATRIIAISPEVAASLGPDHDGKISVIYNPMDTTRLVPNRVDREKVREEIGIPSEAFLVLSLGGTSPWKGTTEILDSARYTDENVHFLFAGPSFPEVKRPHFVVRCLLRLEDLLIRFRLQSHPVFRYASRCSEVLRRVPLKCVHHAGFRKDVTPLLEAADVLVFAGMAPHFPRPVFEAWLMEKPVIIFDTPGIVENITVGEDGLVTEQKNGKALAATIHQMAAMTYVERRKMGRKGKNKVSGKLSANPDLVSLFSDTATLKGKL